MHIELETTPYNEECAQVGQHNYAAVARAEALTYAAALQAIYGPAPDGTRFAIKSNPHDFGSYLTLLFVVSDETPQTTELGEYIEHLESGMKAWISACFHAPFDHRRADQSTKPTDPAAAIRSALRITRPLPDGRFHPADNQRLHENLCAAYPQLADNFELEAA